MEASKGSTKDVVTEFYIREANAVHDVLDELGVPREIEGEKLSMSQRAKELLDAMLKFNTALIAWQRAA